MDELVTVSAAGVSSDTHRGSRSLPSPEERMRESVSAGVISDYKKALRHMCAQACCTCRTVAKGPACSPSGLMSDQISEFSIKMPGCLDSGCAG